MAFTINFNEVSDEPTIYEVLPEGEYEAVITEVKAGTTKNGNDKWDIVFETAEGDRIYDSLVFTEKTLNRVKKYYSLVGFDFTVVGEEYEPEPDDLMDGRILVSLGIREYTKKDGSKGTANEVNLFDCEPVQAKPVKGKASAAKNGRPF